MSVAAPAPTPITTTRPGYDWEAAESIVTSELERYAAGRGLDVVARDAHGTDRFRLEVRGFSYPDRVGSGTLHVWGERIAGENRVRMEMEHDRVFAGSGNRVYLNDYKFARRVGDGHVRLTDRVLREALAHVDASVRATETVRERARAGGARLVDLTLRITRLRETADENA